MASTANDQTNRRDASGWSASHYNKTASFVYSLAFTTPVLELLAAQPGERILDVGCGSGEVTKIIQEVVERGDGGVVVGTDLSESMITKAKENGIKHAFIADAQDLEYPRDEPGFPEKFDAVFSNAALHWCKRDPLGVLTGIRKVLKPGGRVAVEMGGFMNAIGVRSALHDVVRSKGRDPEELDPWYFPSMEDYVKLLVTAGFEPTHISLTPRITPLPTGLYDWLDLFARNSFLRDFTDEEAREIMRDVEDRCRGDCRDASGKWAMMYTRLRFTAVLKPDEMLNQ
ncbi:putative methyltransferase C70.08c [Psilocybe cubensis]|uniref:Methyltransferase type 11 domain-containing protein n=2 Tax=Psilocybe cubensis TaxID=181762 RepID=A0A8H8CH55_PSICU|nr:putative methyltransferase C70.08c [Psilocybe cubensis]KAH9480552.1 putative methyltransferase C70.08c [Psilocybe cubensis]